jgi:hypothetical protein
MANWAQPPQGRRCDVASGHGGRRRLSVGEWRYVLRAFNHSLLVLLPLNTAFRFRQTFYRVCVSFCCRAVYPTFLCLLRSTAWVL